MVKFKKVVATMIALSTLLSTQAFADKLVANYTQMGVPSGDTSFKTWMPGSAITSKSSPQYKFLHTYAYVDSDGFYRCAAETEAGITDDYYLVALGSYYGSQIGTKYRITFSNGSSIYAVLGDQKADVHTNSTHQYAAHRDVVEFIINKKTLNASVRRMGSANVLPKFNGTVSSIEKIDFSYEPEPAEVESLASLPISSLFRSSVFGISLMWKDVNELIS